LHGRSTRAPSLLARAARRRRIFSREGGCHGTPNGRDRRDSPDALRRLGRAGRESPDADLERGPQALRARGRPLGRAADAGLPELSFEWEETVAEKEEVEDKATGGKRIVVREKTCRRSRAALLDRSQVDVDLRLEQRKKGLLWYATYAVDFRGDYAYVHDDDREGTLLITYRFPTTRAVYGDFRLEVDGRSNPSLAPEADGNGKVVRQRVP